MKNKWSYGEINIVFLRKEMAIVYGSLAFHNSHWNGNITHIPTGNVLLSFHLHKDWVWGNGDVKAYSIKKIKKAIEEIHELRNWDFGKLGEQLGDLPDLSQSVNDILIKHKVVDSGKEL